uniref:Transposase-associated domain-containing protein n=2 Tax=Oryza TaxID=4527 RepID=A0A0E0QIE7_ORYRU
MVIHVTMPIACIEDVLRWCSKHVLNDLLRNGFDENYKRWVYHGEDDSDEDDVAEGNNNVAVPNMISNITSGY